MTTISSSRVELGRTPWQTIVLLSLGFWLSGCLILDMVIMPSLFVSGMMSSSEFAIAGNMMFGVFNRVELICGALALTGVLALSNIGDEFGRRGNLAFLLSLGLFAIAFIDTYSLVPQMSAMGMQLNLFDAVGDVPSAMTGLHERYFILDAVKIALGGTLLTWCYRG
jgi:hypothetical protein